MKLHEYQSRDLLAGQAIPLPPARLAVDSAGAAEAAAELGGRVVIKAQVLSGGRGKAGGIKLVGDPAAAARSAGNILGRTIGGHQVQKVLVAKAVDIAAEYYLAVLPDRRSRKLVVMASAAGGIDIELTAAENPAAIHRRLCPADGQLEPYQGRELAFDLGLPKALVGQFAQIAASLVKCLQINDASLVEVNPLVISGDQLLAIDAKISIDDSALFRQPCMGALRNPEEESESEALARDAGISYVELDGSLGCMVNGAGLAMALLDVIVAEGGRPANFLDIGGGADADQVARAMRIILCDPSVRAVLVNIFGGITRCDDVARGITAALAEIDSPPPLISRLAGTNQAEGLAILRQAGISAHRDMLAAVRAAVALTQGPAERCIT